VASTIVAISRNFVALLLLLKDSPPPPKTGDKPVPGACRRIAATRSVETIIWKMVIIITPIIYVLLPEMQAFVHRDKAGNPGSPNQFL
jgi:hypothetical protein